MNTKPARPEGDALPGTILQIGGASPGNGWGANSIEVRESTGGVGWKWRTITAIENQRLIDALNTRATSDAAEGAAGVIRRNKWAGDSVAPPKPAPDAMREAIIKECIISVNDYHTTFYAPEQEGRHPRDAAIADTKQAIIRRLEALYSAPDATDTR